MSCGRFDSTDVLTRKPPRDILACTPSTFVCVVSRRLYRMVGNVVGEKSIVFRIVFVFVGDEELRSRKKLENKMKLGKIHWKWESIYKPDNSNFGIQFLES